MSRWMTAYMFSKSGNSKNRIIIHACKMWLSEIKQNRPQQSRKEEKQVDFPNRITSFGAHFSKWTPVSYLHTVLRYRLHMLGFNVHILVQNNIPALLLSLLFILLLLISSHVPHLHKKKTIYPIKWNSVYIFYRGWRVLLQNQPPL